LGMTSTQVKALLHRARRNFKRSWISALGFLLPTRWIQRLRGLESSSVEHVAQGGLSNVQVITSCSTLMQSCGQFVAERVAPIVTAGFVGVATMGAVAGAPADQAAASSQGATSARGSNHLRVLHPNWARTDDKGHGHTKTEDGSEVKPAPVPEPTPSPSPTTTPTPAPVPAEEPVSAPDPGQAPPEPEPSLGPAAVARETSSYLGFDRGQPVPKGTIASSSATVDCDGASVFQQMETTLANGSNAYATSFRAEAGSSSVALSLNVWPRGPSDANVQYNATGTLIQETRATQDEMTLRYSGTYSNSDAPDAEQAGLPSSGGFVLDFVLDCRTSAVVSVSLLLEAK
jgi:hypothetical protein